MVRNNKNRQKNHIAGKAPVNRVSKKGDSKSKEAYSW